MTAFVFFLAALALMAFLFAAASLLADYLAAHRRTDLPPQTGHHRLGLENDPRAVGAAEGPAQRS